MKHFIINCLTVLFCLLITTLSASAQSNTLAVRNSEVMPGDTAFISFDMTNASPVVAFQFVFTLPEGIRPLADRGIEYSAALSSRKTEAHTMTIRQRNDSTYMVMAFSADNKPFTGNSGSVMQLKVVVNDSLDLSTQLKVKLSDVVLATVNGDNVMTSFSNGTISIASTPDLSISKVATSANSVSPGDTLSVSWQVCNKGKGAASEGWKEFVYIETSDSESRLLGTIPHEETFGAGAILSRSASFPLPKILGINGVATIRIKVVDVSGKELKKDLEDNSVASAQSVAVASVLYISPQLSSISEGETTSFLVTRSGSTANNEVFTVKHNVDTRLDIPNTITIQQEESGTYLNVKVISNEQWDDLPIDTLTVLNSTYGEVVAYLEIEDDTDPQLAISSYQQDVTEGGTITFTVKAPRVVRSDLAVMLTCDMPSRFQIPSDIIIKAGEDSVNVAVTATDDDIPDIDKPVKFFASAPGYINTSMFTTLLDNDVPTLLFSLSPKAVSEADGPTSVTATIRRTDNIDKKVTIRLSDDANGGIYYGKQSFTMEAGVEEAVVTLGPIDNNVVDGERKYVVQAGVWISSCSCNAGGASTEVACDTLTVYDNDGPSLSISTSSSAIKEGGEIQVTIKRNTTGEEELLINLTSDHDDALEYPSTVTMAKGVTTVTFKVKCKENEVSGDGFTATITASAEGYAKTTLYFSVTDQTLPDAKITAFSLSKGKAEPLSTVDVLMTISNSGSQSLPEMTEVVISLSNGQELTAYLQEDLLVGKDTTLQRTLTLPSKLGTYKVYATVNPDRKVKELNYSNNTSSVLAINVVSPYTFTVSTDKAVYNQGDSITISGNVSGSDVAGKKIDVYVINNGYRQVLKATTDSDGLFVVDYKPNNGQIGTFSVGACYPGEGLKKGLTSFCIYGLKRVSTSAITCETTVGETYNGKFAVTNPGSVALTGAKVTIASKPENWDVNASVLSTISANGTADITFTLKANAASEGEEWEEVRIYIETAEGAILPVIIYCHARTSKGKLKADRASINTTMTKGATREYFVTITNIGKGSTGAISLALPSWIRTSTPIEMSPLAKDESATIVLQLSPTDDMQLNVPVKGQIGINCANGEGLAIPYYIEPVSESKGKMVIDVCDEYTYYTKEAPHLSGATVTVKHPTTGAEVATGTTDSNGIFSADLPEGWYAVTVKADRHDTYGNNIEVAPGRSDTTTVNLSINGVTVDWKVEETEVEDRYDITTTVKFETNVPVPEVVLSIPSKIDADSLGVGESLIFSATLTNKGLITAKDVVLLLPSGLKTLSFEALGVDSAFNLAPQQSVTIPVRVTRVNGEVFGAKGISRVGHLDNEPCASKVGTLYFWDCGNDRKWHRYSVTLQLGSCGSVNPPILDDNDIEFPDYYTPFIKIILDPSDDKYRPSTEIVVGPPYDDLGCEPCQNGYLIAGAKCIGHFVGDAVETLKSLMMIDTGDDEDKDPSLREQLNGCYSLLESIASTFDACVNTSPNFDEAYNCYKNASGTVDKLFDDAVVSVLGPFVPADKLDKFKKLGKKMLKWKNIIDNVADCANDFVHACDHLKDDVTEANAKRKAPSTSNYLSEMTSNMAVIGRRVEAFSNVLDAFWGEGAWYDITFYEMQNILDSVDFKKQTAESVLCFKPESWSKEQFNSFFAKVSAGDDAISSEIKEQLEKDIEMLHQTHKHFEDMGYETPADYTKQKLPEVMDYVNGRRSSVCSSVTLQLSQSMVMTRQAFRGTLTINNGSSSNSMTNVKLNLTVKDSGGKVATSHEFQVNPESLEGFEGELNLTSGWSLKANSTGKATILFIPTKYAAETTPEQYSFGGTLTYVDPFTNLEVTRELTPITLTVKPSPVLDMTYFMQRDVIGDDPLTKEVEPMEEAEFALLIHNTGYGDATNVRMVTNQPEIVDNEKGLAIKFELIRSSLNGGDKSLALGGSVTTDFGTIAAQGTTYAQWWLTSTLMGHFSDYNISATHVTSYDNPDLSLLGNVSIHELIRSVDGGNGLTGFLVNDVPDAKDTPDNIYFTNGEKETVAQATGSATKNGTECTLIVTPALSGWNYLSVASPLSGKATITSVTRGSDGKQLSLRNVWLTDRTLIDGKEPVYENKIHLVDNFSSSATETYIITFAALPDTILAVDTITGIPAEGTVIAKPMKMVTVKFNKDILPSTFTTDDISLSVQGVSVDVSNVKIARVDSKTYTIDLSSVSVENGFYVLTVQTTGITDSEGYTGKTGRNVSWTMFNDGKVKVSVSVIPEGVGTVKWIIPESEAQELDYGTAIKLQAMPNNGFSFEKWTVNGDSVSNAAIFTRTALTDIEVIANFAKGIVTSIDLLDIGNEGVIVYNLEGMVVVRHADKATLRRLPKGVYIVNGKKVVID